MILRKIWRSRMLGRASFSSDAVLNAASAPPLTADTVDLTNSESEVAVSEIEFARYNQSANEQLKQMNENLIENIVSDGGIKGWHLAPNLDDLTRTFEFRSFEHAAHFMNEVGKVASKKDHHPEWKLHGSTLTVRLTSHFANNKVTLYDFQLAEAMNKRFEENFLTRFEMYPRVS